MRFPRRSTALSRQRGLSLIELMISITLGLLILAATVTVFLDIAGTSRTQTAASRMDDNGRFALETITRTLRMAGYRNWGGPQSTPPGYTGTGDFVVDGADGTAATIGYADTLNVRLVGSGPAVGSADGTVVDCLGNAVPEAADWASRVVSTFAIRLNGTVRELTCDNGSGPVALAANIDTLQVLYGLATTAGSRVPDRWVPAAGVGALWDRVVAVRVSLLVSSDPGTSGLPPDSRTYRLFDTGYTNAADLGTVYDASLQGMSARSRLRKIYTTTVFLRNRTFASET